MQDDLRRPTLILFAKSPICGRVKTRLMPELNAEQAAQVAAALIENTVRQATLNWPGPVSMSVWPDATHPVFESLVGKHDISISIQSDGDLGKKMLNALRVYTDRGSPAAILGCDVPHCPRQELLHAYHLLQHGRNVIGPSRDGGYYLIGLQRTCPEIFHNIDWGGVQVIQQTLDAANRCSLIFERLMRLVDVDTYWDLKLAAKSVPDLNYWIK